MSARKNLDLSEINNPSDRPSAKDSGPVTVPRAYLDLGQTLDLPEVARRIVRLVEEVTGPAAKVSLIDWEDEVGGLAVLAGLTLSTDFLEAARFLQVAGEPAYLDLTPTAPLSLTDPALPARPDPSLTALAYFPLGHVDPPGQGFQGGLLILDLNLPKSDQRDQLTQLAALVEPALVNAAAYRQLLYHCRKLETIRQAPEKRRVSAGEQPERQEKEIAGLKEEFISLISHELRNPMASILGFSELMLTRQLTEAKSRLYTETIYQEALRLSSLINNFLDIQRLGIDRPD